jgi:hypothetical protein
MLNDAARKAAVHAATEACADGGIPVPDYVDTILTAYLSALPTPEDVTAPAFCGQCEGELSCDVLVPDAVWVRISPNPVDGWKGGGILCPQCIADALSAKLSAAEAENASLRKLIEVKDGALPEDVVELVIAARIVAFEDQSPEAIQALDKASEAFSDRVPWDDEPEEDFGAAHQRIEELTRALGDVRPYLTDALDAHDHSDGRELLGRIDAILSKQGGER